MTLKVVPTRVFSILVLSFFFVVAVTGMAQNKPWEAPAFAGDPAAMLREASVLKLPKNTELTYLYREIKIQIDAQNREIYTRRVVYLISTQAAAEDSDYVEARWSPWYQERPVIRARVISPNGTVHVLDPATIAEVAQDNQSDEVYGDTRVLRGPLPAITPGAIVEEELVLRDTAPYFRTADAGSITFGGPAREERIHVELSAPLTPGLQYKTYLLDSAKAEKKEFGDNITVTFDIGPMESLKATEPFLPGDIVTKPLITYTTAKSWNDIAAPYAQIFEESIKAASLQEMVQKATRGLKDRDRIIGALLDALHRNVRYTGVEFGQSSIVPHTPAQVLKNKYGDCKDKAALLIAMLRQAGINAEPALLITGPGRDLDEDIPGMFFDHAIVHVPGDHEAWIDATAEFHRFGTLPVSDQGRHALIVTPQTTQLVTIPEWPSTANVRRERREIILSEYGPARIVEETEPSGEQEAAYRSGYASSEAKKLKESLDNYVKSEYLSDNLAKFEFTDVRDLSKKWVLRIETEKAKRGWTGFDDAGVAVLLGDIANDLPDLMSEEPLDKDKERSESEEDRARKHDLLMPMPFVTEWNYHVVPPPGFRPKPLPQKRQRQIGPGTLSEEYVSASDGSINATFRFDSGKRRYTVQDIEAVRIALSELRKGAAVLLTFEQIGQAHLEEGRVRDALAEFGDLLKLHPKEALHHIQLSRAMLKAGLGDSAREEARLATTLEPNSATAHANLGWVLQHDLIGRRFGKGFDLEGSISAYRKAKELDPTEYATRIDYAILLEHDTDGERYGPKSHLKEAIQEYIDIGDTRANEFGASENLNFALFRARRFQELKDRLQKLPSNATRDALLLAATTAISGAPEALREATRAGSTEEVRKQALTNAGQYLMEIRMYEQAAELTSAGIPSDSNAASMLTRAQALRSAKRFEDISNEDTPENVVRRFFYIQIVKQATSSDAFLQLFSRDALPQKKPENTIKRYIRESRRTQNSLAKSGIPLDVLADLTINTLRMTVEHSDKLVYRVNTAGANLNQPFFVVKEDGKYRLLAEPDTLYALGRRALSLAQAGNLTVARQLLDWAREQQKLAGGEDPFLGRAFPRLWSKGEQGDSDKIQYAAAALAAQGPDAEQFIPILLKGREKAQTDSDRQKFDFALAEAYGRAEKYVELEPVARRLLMAAPESLRAFMSLEASLTEQQKWSEAEKAANDRLSRLPDDADARRTLVQLAELQGNFKSGIELARKAAAAPKAEDEEFNSLAWAFLFTPPVPNEALEAANRASMLSQNGNPGVQHTTACIYAVLGKPREARELMLQAMNLWGLDEPDGASWYAFGLIAEEYGIKSAAVAAYKRVDAPEDKAFIPLSSYALAQQRLRALDAESAKSRASKSSGN